MKLTKDYIGKGMHVFCKTCGSEMQTQMIDLKRTPKNTICKSCRYENDRDNRWYQEK